MTGFGQGSRRLISVGVVATLLLGGGAAVAEEGTPGGDNGLSAPSVIRAQLVPRDFTTLSSETAARIDRITRRAGEHFAKGDTLVDFDCAEQRAELAKARAELLAADKTYSVNRQLAALKSVGQLELEVSAANIDKARADVALAAAAVSKCTIAAPFSGVVVEQKARQSQYTTPGQPLLDIIDDHTLEVEFIAPSLWLRWMKPGYPFTVTIEETGKTYGAHIELLGGRVDPVSQSIKITGIVDSGAHDLMAGMSGRVHIAMP